MSKKNKEKVESINEEIQQGLEAQQEQTDESVENQSVELQQQQEIEKLRLELAEAKKEASTVKASYNEKELKERVAHLEGKLGEKESQEVIFQKRLKKYRENVAKRKAKEAKKAAALAEIDAE